MAGGIYVSPGNDYIEFDDCSGVIYGDVQNDELRSFEASVELHRGGDDKLMRVYKQTSFLKTTSDNRMIGGIVSSYPPFLLHYHEYWSLPPDLYFCCSCEFFFI